MRRMVGNYARVMDEGRAYGIAEARKRVCDGDADSRRSFRTSTSTAASQLDQKHGDWFVFYFKPDSEVKMLPSGFNALGPAKVAARRLRAAGFQVLINRAHKA